MNLELIRKYEKEFLHMLHGGTLLSRVMISDEDDEMYTIWYKVNACNNMKKWSSDYLFALSDIECKYLKPQFIINDEYCTYRKVLADGKTIEYYTIANYKCTITRMDELEDLIKSNHSGKYIFRIKPEEPEFKIGDWITVNGPTGPFTECISGVADDTYTLSGTNICYKSQASKWEPKEGEVCIFWDNKHTNEAIIARYSHSERSFYYPLKMPNSCYQNCMPFTGALPPHIKD